MRAREPQGFTLIEMMVVVAILGVTAAMAVPAWVQFQNDQRLRETTRTVANAMAMARSQAIATGSNHVVYLAAGAGTDACGTPLLDPQGNPVPVLVLNDGPPGPGTNCCIDPAETRDTEPAQVGVNWGVTFAAAPAPTDAGGGVFGTGSSFADPAGAQASWVLFRPDGIPVAFTPTCNRGAIGSGSGGVYVTNGNRDYGVVLNPLGGVKVHHYERAAGAWIN